MVSKSTEPGSSEGSARSVNVNTQSEAMKNDVNVVVESRPKENPVRKPVSKRQANLQGFIYRPILLPREKKN